MRNLPAIGFGAALLHWKRHYLCAHVMGKTSLAKFIIVKPHEPAK
jgi:hypothetical protein